MSHYTPCDLNHSNSYVAHWLSTSVGSVATPTGTLTPCNLRSKAVQQDISVKFRGGLDLYTNRVVLQRRIKFQHQARFAMRHGAPQQPFQASFRKDHESTHRVL